MGSLWVIAWLLRPPVAGGPVDPTAGPTGWGRSVDFAQQKPRGDRLRRRWFPRGGAGGAMNLTSVRALAAFAAISVLTLTSCSTPSDDTGERVTDTPASPSAAPSSAAPETPSVSPSPSASDAAALSSDGQPMTGELSIPKIGLTNLEVVPYR